jgi:DNA polymerase-3 subunit gamma/tau
LATTELDKVPETIVSRCQTFTFRKPGREVIRKQVAMIATKEGFDLDAGAADLIALLGDGSFRDALGMLEKVISASGGSVQEGNPASAKKKAEIRKITRQQVEALTGAPRASLVNEFIEHVLAKDADKALATLAEAEQAAISMNTFIALILEKARFILLVQHSKSSEGSVKERVSPDDFEFISAQAAKKLLTPAILSILLEAAEAIPRARIEALPLELAVVRICG